MHDLGGIGNLGIPEQRQTEAYNTCAQAILKCEHCCLVTSCLMPKILLRRASSAEEGL